MFRSEGRYQYHLTHIWELNAGNLAGEKGNENINATNWIILKLPLVDYENYANSPFRPVTQSQNKLQEEEGQIQVLQNGVDNRSGGIAEWECPLRAARFWSGRASDEVHDDGSCEPV